MDYIKIEIESDENTYSKLRGPWILAHIKPTHLWPDKPSIVNYDKEKLYLFPGDDRLYPCIGIRFNDQKLERAAEKKILKFITEYSWVEQESIIIVHWSGGGYPFRMARSDTVLKGSSYFRINYLPNVDDENIKLALAFYREALGLGHKAYSFLSLYKIINLFYKGGKSQKQWIKDNLDLVKDNRALERVKELLKNKINIEEYLYVSCRCAIAHAGTDPTVDPEDFDDLRRLSKDLPLIKNLAEILIENELNIKTRHTVWKEHKYELSGFRMTIGEKIIDKILNQDEIDANEIILPDSISIRLWNKKQYTPFEHMGVCLKNITGSSIILECSSPDDLIIFYIELDFKNERLLINPLQGIKISDNNSSNSAKNISEVYRFLAEYFTNGILEIWDASSEQCLGFCDPFIPTNIDLDGTITNFENVISKFYKKAIEREQPSNSV